jgi:hypothetical protein
MNIVASPYDIACLALAPLAAIAALWLKRPWQVLALLFVVAFAGYGLMFAADRWIDQRRAAAMDQIANPTPQQIDQFNTDGASKGALALFGFPLSLGYAGFSFIVVFGVRRVIKGIHG